MNLTFKPNLAVIIIVICGVLVALPLSVLAATPTQPSKFLTEKSPLYPGAYCVASYSIVYDQVKQWPGVIPRIVADDFFARGVNLMYFLLPLAEDEGFDAKTFTDEVDFLRNRMLAGDGGVWVKKVQEYDCRQMTEQWAVLWDPSV